MTEHNRHTTIRVLHVDDEPDLADLTATFLTREDDRFEVETATNVAEGLDLLDRSVFDCIVSDYEMPGENGIEFLEAVREDYPDLPFILFTGKGSEKVASDAISAGVSDYLQKGSSTDQYALLANRITNLISQYRIEGQLETRAQQQQCVADLGKEALAGASLETLFDHAVELVADALDNEYAKVLEYRPEHEDVLLRAGVGWREGLVGEATVGIGEDSQAGHTIRSEEPIIVEDLRTEDRFRGSALLVEHDVVSGVCVIIGSYDDPWGVLGTHTTERTVVTDNEVTFVQNVANVLANAIDREERETELRRRECRYHAVFNDPNILVGLLDTDGSVLDINQTALEYVDVSLDHITDTPFWKTPWFDHSEAVRNDVQDWIDRAASGEYVEFEADLVRPNGEQYTVAGVFRPVTNDDGEVVSLLISDRDITEQKDRERELEIMSRRLDSILDNTTTPMFMKDDEGRYVFVNRGYRELFGLEDAEIVGRTDHELHPPEMAEHVQENDRDVLERGEALETEERSTANGHDRVYLSSKVPIYDTGDHSDSEQPIAIFGVANDITELKAREQRLRETTSRLEVLFEKSPDMIDVLDPEGTLLDVNRRFCEELGYDENEVIGRPIWEIDQLVDADNVKTLLSDFVLDERRKFDGVYERRDGSTVPVEVHLLRLDIEGEDRFLAISRDITERVEREREAQREKRRFETIFTNSNDAIFILDPDNDEIVDANPKTEELLGYTVEELKNDVNISDVHREHIDEFRSFLEGVTREGSGWTDDYHCITKNGVRREAEFSMSTLSVEDGSYLIANVRDITRRIERERELQRERDRLDDFAGIVSHDLRNPLSVARGRLELVRDECDSEHLDDIAHAHERMNVLIDDLLMLAREGETVCDTEPIDLARLIENCWENVATADATLTTDIDRRIYADQSRLQQLPENLMRNAVEHGGTDVTVTIGELDDGFYVEDDGPGIPEDERDDVFEAGYSTVEDGTGFGLSIVKQMAQAHGWNVRVTDGSEGGARFEITGVESTAE